ncbi:MAG: gliding motility protein GldN [Bacteroidales bacterium]|nr:gliding motility protein GldN [Bacteroidales bacterium]
MKKIFFISIFCFSLFWFNTNTVTAQVNDGIYEKEHVPSRKRVNYSYLREADVMWKKRIWRIIDLREKINHPLYFPTQKLGDRMSLMQLFLWGITNEGLTVYSTDDDNFSAPMTRKQVEEKMGAVDDTIPFTNPETGEEEMQIIPGEVHTSEIKQFMLKEEWYFDRQLSVMKVRIIGISPIRFYIKDDNVSKTIRKTPVFWVYFPEVRRILANHAAFNPQNDAERRTFDDIFEKRYFNSFIVQESNVYNDRSISSYALGVEALLEANRIKDKLFKAEQDLWEY